TVSSRPRVQAIGAVVSTLAWHAARRPTVAPGRESGTLAACARARRRGAGHVPGGAGCCAGGGGAGTWAGRSSPRSKTRPGRCCALLPSDQRWHDCMGLEAVLLYTARGENERPAVSLATVTEAGVPVRVPVRGRDHKMASGTSLSRSSLGQGERAG